METKTCTKCGESKPLAAFYAFHRNADGKCSQCKACMKAGRKAPRTSEQQAKYTRRSLMKKQGYTPEEYDAKVEEQNGRCALCGEPPERLLLMDHDHESGEKRELLCNACNLGLGWFDDSPAKLRLAIEYLLRHGKT